MNARTRGAYALRRDPPGGPCPVWNFSQARRGQAGSPAEMSGRASCAGPGGPARGAGPGQPAPDTHD